MRSYPRCARPAPSVRGFTLIELSVVVAIISVLATLGLELSANFVNKSAVTTSRERLAVVDEALVQYFKVYGRLPCPAVASTAPETTSYGLEDCGNGLVVDYTDNGGINGPTPPGPGNGIFAGAVPFRTLNLPMNYSLDGFNTKLRYVVTRNLTSAGVTARRFGFQGASGTPTDNGMGGIEIRTGILAQPCNTSACQIIANPIYNNPSNMNPNGAAYIVLSSGPDKRGGYSWRGVMLENCASGGDLRSDAQNCVLGDAAVSNNMAVTTIPYNVFYDNRYNAGLNLRNYFDDVVVWRTKGSL